MKVTNMSTGDITKLFKAFNNAVTNGESRFTFNGDVYIIRNADFKKVRGNND